MIDSVRKTFDFSGTASKREYWSYFSLYLVAIIAFLIAEDTNVLSGRSIQFAKPIVFLSFLPLPSLAARRLHDAGRSGWWGLLVFPLSVFALVVVGLLRSKESDRGWPNHPVHRAGQTALMFFLILFALRLIWAPYWIPSGSMKPTLLVGDYAVINLWQTHADRGNVMVFRHPAQPLDFLARVVGLPGDSVQMRAGKLWVNGEPVETTQTEDFEELNLPVGSLQRKPICLNQPREGGNCIKEAWSERLPNGRKYVVLNAGPGALDNSGVFTVPEGHVFVLGDNRDNATDSRAPLAVGGMGFIPLENMIGKLDYILFSGAGKSYLDITNWRSDRYLKKVE